MPRAFLLAATLVVAFAPPSVAAEEETVHTGGEIVVEDERLRAEEVFQDTAIETEVITRQEIQDTPGTSVADVVEYRAGIRTQQRIQGQDAAVSIEGMPPEYTHILVDGQRWSGEIGGVGDLADVPLTNIERIELLRGNQGTRYGTDAGGGVINVVTKGAPEEGARVAGDLVLGTDEKLRAGGAVSGRLGPLGLSLSGDFDTVNGYDAPTDDDIVFVGIGGDDSVLQSHFLYGKWNLPVGESLELRGNGVWRVEDDDLVPEGTHTHLTTEETNWRGNGGFDWLALDSTSVIGDFTWYDVETDSKVGREFVLREDEWKGDLRFDHFLETGPITHSILGGGELAYQRLDLDEGDLPPGIDNDDLAAGRDVDETFTIPSLYLQTESAVTDWFSLVLGVRARFHSEFASRVLPQVGVLVKPHETLKLRASWGLNYRTPSLRDLYQPPTPQLGGAYFLAGNEDLDPERSMSTRAGLEWSPAEWMSLATTGFYNDIDDHIRSQLAGEIQIGEQVVPPGDPGFDPVLQLVCDAQAQFYPDPADWTPECGVGVTLPITSNVFAKSNLDSVRTWGVEAQLRLRVTRHAQLGVDYTWLQTEVTDSNVALDELPNEPEHVVALRGLLTLPWTDTRLLTAFRWRDSVIPEGSGTGLISFADGSEHLDPTWQLDFRVTQPLWDRGRLYFDAINVTNERREDSYAIRGSTFMVGLAMEYGQ
ncbi:MAG: TonB-dependent receptor plug domain-containing protein [Myxococcota bacterium]